MSKLSRGRFSLVILVLAALVLFVAGGGTDKGQGGPFNWTMALQEVKTGKLLPFSAPVKAKTGEQFRIIINPQADCYCYVIAENDNGDEVTVVYSGQIKANATWQSVDLLLTPPRGTISFFVVTSRNEQTDLSQKIAAFKANSGATQRRALMNQVFSIRSEVSKYKEAPEKPILMGAALRGAPDKSEGVEYSGLDTYVKTISIEH